MVVLVPSPFVVTLKLSVAGLSLDGAGRTETPLTDEPDLEELVTQMIVAPVKSVVLALITVTENSPRESNA